MEWYSSPPPLKKNSANKFQDDVDRLYQQQRLHPSWISTRGSVNKEFYEGVLKRQLQRIRRVRTELYPSGQWNLLLDNAHPHTAIRMSNFLAQRKATVLQHPHYSPDVVPEGFFLFQRLKLALKGYASQTLRIFNIGWERASNDFKRSVYWQFPAAIGIQPMSEVCDSNPDLTFIKENKGTTTVSLDRPEYFSNVDAILADIRKNEIDNICCINLVIN